jgi:MraZ protein
MTRLPRFIGRHRATLDDKGRLTIPAKLKEEITKDDASVNRVVVSTWWDDCLALYPVSNWEAYTDVLASLPTEVPENRRLRAAVLAYTADLDVDKAGRILLPLDLRDEGGIGPEVRDLLLVGDLERVLIWDASKARDYIKMDNSERSRQFAQAKRGAGA